MTEDGRKHLEFVQLVIARLANNSLALKGWSVTLLAGLFALAADKASRSIPWVALIAVLFFWILDAHFLGQERLYRSLYEHLRKLSDKEWEGLNQRRYSLTPKDYGLTTESLMKIMVRPILLGLYGALAGCVVIFGVLLRVLR